MIPLEEARRYVLDRVRAPAPSQVHLDEALGLVLAEAVTSQEAVPAFANTAMDGYALRAADTADAPVELDVVGSISAGDTGDLRVGAGQAARIMTGAPMPLGADAVIRVELTSLRGASAGRVIVHEPVRPRNHVRGPGEDVGVGDMVMDARTLITPGRVGLLAAVGAYEVEAYRRPRVGVLSTGDELSDEPGPLRRGQIRDTNRRTLLGLVSQSGFTGVDLGVARDDPDEIESAFRCGVKECDAVLSSGGVSMGDFDYVKVVLDRIGEMRWMQIAIKPAKPFAVRACRGHARVRLARQPGVVDGQLRVVGETRLAGNVGLRRARAGPRAHEGRVRRRPLPRRRRQDPLCEGQRDARRSCGVAPSRG